MDPVVLGQSHKWSSIKYIPYSKVKRLVRTKRQTGECLVSGLGGGVTPAKRLNCQKDLEKFQSGEFLAGFTVVSSLITLSLNRRVLRGRFSADEREAE